MARLFIIGTIVAGKSVLGEQAAGRLACRSEELTLTSAAGLVQVTDEVFRSRVSEVHWRRMRGWQWYLAGAGCDLSRADTLVWLDYPLGPLTLWRLLRRTVRLLSRRRFVAYGQPRNVG